MGSIRQSGRSSHGAVEALNRAYRASGVALPSTRMVSDAAADANFSNALVIAPPSAQGSPWLKRFGETSDAFASGWMAIRGAKRQRGVDRGFVISDHADWPGLQRAIAASGASRVLLTHGQVPVMVRFLRERGIDAEALETEFEGEGGSDGDAALTTRRRHDISRHSYAALARCDHPHRRKRPPRWQTIFAPPRRPMPAGRCGF
jgi:hypothetical protein